MLFGWKSIDISGEHVCLQGVKSKPSKNPVGSKALLGFSFVALLNISQIILEFWMEW
jgi:hypothetical protein